MDVLASPEVSETSTERVRSIPQHDFLQARRNSHASRYYPGSSPKRMHGNTRSVAPSDDFVHQVHVVTRQLKSMKREKQGILNPLESSFLMQWDVVTALALVYTATLTPFEVAFIESPASFFNLWFLVNRAIDIIFITDLVLQFFIAFENVASTRSDGNTSFNTHHTLVWDRRRICAHYLLGSFAVDLLSILPSFLDVLPMLVDSSDNAPAFLSEVRTLRSLRALRLVKLIRLMRAQRVIARVSTRIAMPYTSLIMLGYLFAVLLAAHWYACIFALQASLHNSPSDTWLGIYGYCDGPIEGNWTHNDGNAIELECPGLSLSRWYIAAFAWATMIITGTGGTDAYPSQASEIETVLVVVLVLFGALLWTQVLATFCDIAANADPAKIESRQLIDDVNRFCSQERLPTEMRRRLRHFFAQRRYIAMSNSATSVIHKMSASLQLEVTMLVHYHWLRRIWFLRGGEAACLVAVALGMEPRVFSPSEVPELEAMYVIHRGCVLFGGCVLTSGKYWGEDIILTNVANYTPMKALCMAHVETFTLTRPALFHILERFPLAQRCVKRAMAKLALKRTMLRIRAEAHRLERKYGRGRRLRRESTDFTQRVLGAALHQVVAKVPVDNAASSLSPDEPPAKAVNDSTYRGPAYYERYYDDIRETNAAVDALRADMSHTKLIVDALHSDMAFLRRGMNQLLSGQQAPTNGKPDRLAPQLPLSPPERHARSRDLKQVATIRAQIATVRGDIDQIERTSREAQEARAEEARAGETRAEEESVDEGEGSENEAHDGKQRLAEVAT
mmetsp:Transcript_11138/g.28549  ORF Transcript_11138/g.28549 Transcript_11138/m.28549 type:complete len:790 (-) Transcript_11138:107-2476(-)|eukprot:CAMPEP_0115837926 /NCGR_PEP_ID=MMETSP0287-20121206/5468_1 /TAXON_ID=412157 /ORGANISM="Chrysochromulina rotalis, Strain UIO044" /LENGTH=789 /DNA_ID=CAMNT_0003291443 /DNA_START=68 /DNA_END=2437 /DNA_ORIENTATION=-